MNIPEQELLRTVMNDPLNEREEVLVAKIKSLGQSLKDKISSVCCDLEDACTDVANAQESLDKIAREI